MSWNFDKNEGIADIRFTHRLHQPGEVTKACNFFIILTGNRNYWNEWANHPHMLGRNNLEIERNHGRAWFVESS